MSGHIPEIECPACDGWGWLAGPDGTNGPTCTACNGEGWRPMTADELADEAERRAEHAEFRADMALDEQHLRAWEQKQGLRR